MKKKIAMLAFVASSTVYAAKPIDKNCSIASCDAGTSAVTTASKSDPYFACPTRQLSAYTSLVLGLIAMQIQFTGKFPNISDVTGEPEYLDTKDGPNQTRLVLDKYRSLAGVKTFDQAVAACQPGKSGQRVTVLNNPSDMLVMWVKDEKGQTFWMPKGHADTK